MPQNRITVLYKDELYEFNIGSANTQTHKLMDNNPVFRDMLLVNYKEVLEKLFKYLQPSTEEQYNVAERNPKAT
jgi:hypothetical protein